jgi:Polyketide cyclase / dehydrase and lipid transport
MIEEDEAADWVEVRAAAVINCPSEIVFSFACDPFNDIRWLTNVGRTEQLTAGPIGLGSRFRQAPVFLGVPVEVEWEVVDFVANRRIRSRSVAGPLAFVRQYDCEPAGPGAQITKFVRLNLALVPPFVTRAAAVALLGNAADRALWRLKVLLEGGSSPDHAS